MSTITYIDTVGFPRWSELDEDERRHLEAEALEDLAAFEHERRPLAVPAESPADYSGDRPLDGPEADMFGRPIR